MKNLNNTGVTLLEILLAAIIFIISIGGIFATLNAVRAPVANKESSLSAAVFGKQVLESLRFQVSAESNANFYGICSDTCTDFSLALGTHQVSPLPSGLNWPPGLAAKNPGGLIYTVSCADGSSAPCTNANVAHRVDLNINW